MNIIPLTHCNIARFINGCTEKREANVKSLKCLVGEEFSIILYSSRKIKKNEELLYSYGSKYWEKKKKKE